MARQNPVENNNNANLNGASNQNNLAQNPHYENIYESIDQYAAAVAPNPAENVILAQMASNRVNNRNNKAVNSNAPFRNELYDCNLGYDVPRQVLRNNSNYGPNSATVKRRANLNLDINPNRPRYINTNRTYRQRSFDDTESYHYAHNSGVRYENIYEQIHEEPIYRNVNIATNSNGGRVYGRLDVIGHGIGRIERHLSSSCGNIDHYNLGGHYAVLGHSHLGTVGHIRLNAGPAPSNTKESAGKSLNFFSCLGRENSQSMSNICRAAATANNAENIVPAQNNNETSNKSTGAIPKLKNKVAPKDSSPPPVHSTSFNRIPKSSLQWLLVNKWLPLWVGNESDCNFVDLNFMFSRNCEGCGNYPVDRNSLMQFNDGGSEYYNERLSGRRTEGSVRPLRFNSSLSRLRENDRRYIQRESSLDDRIRKRMAEMHSLSHSHENEYMRDRRNDRVYLSNHSETINDPFRRWELNSENNSFRPAVRRITDGTFPNNGNHRQVVRVQINHHSPESPPTQQQQQQQPPPPLAQQQPQPSSSTAQASAQRSVSPNRIENNALTSSTESTSAAQDITVPSPNLSSRTEDDQSSSKSISSAEDDNDEADIQKSSDESLDEDGAAAQCDDQVSAE